MLDRAGVVVRLREIASLLALHRASKFKTRAFVRGARALEAARETIDVLVGEARLEELPGVGASLARQIEELHRTGTSVLLESLREGLPAGVVELAEVGVGLHAVKLLHDELGIATIADLKRAAEDGRLDEVDGFGPKRRARILDAIASYETRRTKLLLADGLRLAAEIEHEILGVPGVESVHLAGSLSRAAELVEEVSLVVGAPNAAAAHTAITKLARFGGAVTSGEGDLHARLADGTRVVVTCRAPASLPIALVRARSSAEHWEGLARRAAERGLAFDGDVLGDDGHAIAIASERAVYEALDLAFVPQELREGAGEIEAAARGESFDDLVAEADVRGFVHCHTTWSDGKGTVAEMARAAKERGASFLTITDHSSAAHYARGLDRERLERQWDEIDAAQEEVGIRIFKGTESDILADGALDWPDSVLDRLDVVIASIHARFRQDEDAMTERVLRAMRHPVFKIWGHPLGRLVGSRPPIPLRVEEVLDALAASRGAIEINGDPHRLDLEPRWAREARARGIPFVLSVDAHSMRELDNLRWAVLLARRAGVRRGEVLNARDAASFAAAVAPRRA